MKLAFVAAAAVSLLLAGQASAQPKCDGEWTIVRVSKLKPGATLAQFQDAVHDHMAWYRSHGFKDNVQLVGRVVVDQPNGAPKLSDREVMTIHRNAPGVSRARQDAAWNAYVAKYRAVSDIETETTACVAVK